MLKLIREQDAPTPSSRLSTSESKPSIAANRQMEPQKLGRFVKGELDWIVMKASPRSGTGGMRRRRGSPGTSKGS